MAKIIGYTDVTATELQVLDGIAVTGTVYASKAVTVDSNKDAADFRNLSGTNLKAGKDAAAGTVTVFPTTTAKGKAVWDVTDQSTNTTVTHRTAAMGQATVITTPDPGQTTASVLLTEGAQTVVGQKNFTAAIKTGAGLGTAATGVTAVEYGTGDFHKTVLTVSSVLPAIAGGAALAVGKLLYTLPAGAQLIDGAYMSMAITQTQAHINADTPKVGLGTVIGVGAVSVLNGTATFMDIITEQTAANCTGTATVKTANPTAGVPLITASGGTKTVHFNAAASWAASGDAAAIIAGTVTLFWRTAA